MMRQPAPATLPDVTVVGAGMSGAACAAALDRAGVRVRVIERADRPGGRMASPVLRGRRVDLGAAYFTVRDEGFAAAVEGWAAAGLVRPWTDTFAVLAPGRQPETTTDPLRWAAPGGLASLVEALLEGIEVDAGAPLTRVGAGVVGPGPVVLAMPDPQASVLATVPDPVAYHPALVVACGFAARTWDFEAAFVNEHPDVEFLADDGARRGDGAPVLVAHSTAALARRHAGSPDEATSQVVAAVHELAGTGEPMWTGARLWAEAKPAGTHPSTFALLQLPDGRDLGLAGDQWCPTGAPRVESAWRSGTDLAAAFLARQG
jgi:renalase